MHQPISTLNLPKNIIDKLEKMGFCYCNEIEENFESLQSKLQLPQWSSLRKGPETKTAYELLQQEEQFKDITTCIPELDSILIDQIIPGCITELTGLPGSGRTQLCLHLAIGVKDVVFIHTNKNLNPARLKEIAIKYCPDPDSVMEKILCIEATDPTEFLACIHFLAGWLPDHKNIKMLIIDSISWIFRQELFMEQTNLRFSVIQDLHSLANAYNFAVVITNDLTYKSTGTDVCNTPLFGDSFFHAINNRVLLSRENNSFSAKVLKTIRTNPKETTISFTL